MVLRHVGQTQSGIRSGNGVELPDEGEGVVLDEVEAELGVLFDEEVLFATFPDLTAVAEGETDLVEVGPAVGRDGDAKERSLDEGGSDPWETREQGVDACVPVD
jgi:hypothetical protein